MKVLLDENFPVQLLQRLVEAGIEAEHLIFSGQRGTPDSAIRNRLQQEGDLVLLTQDTEFADLERGGLGVVIISRVPQALPIARRVELWQSALVPFLVAPPPGRVFEFLPNGEIVGLEPREPT